MAPLLPYRRKLGFDLRQRAEERWRVWDWETGWAIHPRGSRVESRSAWRLRVPSSIAQRWCWRSCAHCSAAVIRPWSWSRMTPNWRRWPTGVCTGTVAPGRGLKRVSHCSCQRPGDSKGRLKQSRSPVILMKLPTTARGRRAISAPVVRAFLSRASGEVQSRSRQAEQGEVCKRVRHILGTFWKIDREGCGFGVPAL
jgi:hypothetical protein